MGLKDEIEDIEEMTPEEYQAYLEEKNDKKHKELIATMEKLIGVLKPIKTDEALNKALKDNAEVMQTLTKKIIEFKPPVQKNEVVVLSDKEEIKKINFIAAELAKTIAEIKTFVNKDKKKQTWDFFVQRDINGQIISINAKEK